MYKPETDTDAQNRLVVAKGEGLEEERIGSLGLADATQYMKRINKVLHIAQGTTFSIL